MKKRKFIVDGIYKTENGRLVDGVVKQVLDEISTDMYNQGFNAGTRFTIIFGIIEAIGITTAGIITAIILEKRRKKKYNKDKGQQ